ncbi:hypothetical protein [Paracoccus sp. (in: a-proteobacteria)]|uniref:hypothetical protein n=1 Tax=Paracoccus sp. TaxID=267 RepID=UPI002AFE709A|nr:hypothetical protein [Paracoccus sp. (in: a-proteobacteria)]
MISEAMIIAAHVTTVAGCGLIIWAVMSRFTSTGISLRMFAILLVNIFIAVTTATMLLGRLA